MEGLFLDNSKKQVMKKSSPGSCHAPSLETSVLQSPSWPPTQLVSRERQQRSQQMTSGSEQEEAQQPLAVGELPVSGPRQVPQPGF